MNLVSLNIESIQVGHPLPFVLRGADGALLAQKGYVIRTREELATLVARGRELCVDTDESGGSHRAYLAQLQRMLIADTNLGEIASMKMTAAEEAGARGRGGKTLPDWPELQLRATQILRAPSASDFGGRFQALHDELNRLCEQTPDATLLALIYLSAQETRMYSATHSMLVSCVCMVVAREMLRWPEARVQQVGHAGLSMNIAMTELQDQLAQQTQPLTAAQIAAVEDHAARSEALLRQLGVADPLWLEAVRCHHHRNPGPLDKKSEAQQMARLVQRADIFGARLAPRVARSPMPVTAAMQASYYDEDHKVDEMGAALVKTLGVYPPGAFVRLASQEVGVVIRRGATATTPRVAVVTNRDGMPTGEPIPRESGMPPWKVTGVVAFKDVRVTLPLDRLLSLV
ncbi:MAG: phosphohydrolase [Gammaproteobacteria bacterium]|jgi:HD-GYP domain-containing protein (c-di-GMP phosphodiesterase class II)|nr:phosphohydrolase [Gammaproteobacteria bacterium]